MLTTLINKECKIDDTQCLSSRDADALYKQTKATFVDTRFDARNRNPRHRGISDMEKELTECNDPKKVLIASRGTDTFIDDEGEPVYYNTGAHRNVMAHQKFLPTFIHLLTQKLSEKLGIKIEPPAEELLHSDCPFMVDVPLMDHEKIKHLAYCDDKERKRRDIEVALPGILTKKTYILFSNSLEIYQISSQKIRERKYAESVDTTPITTLTMVRFNKDGSQRKVDGKDEIIEVTQTLHLKDLKDIVILSL